MKEMPTHEPINDMSDEPRRIGGAGLYIVVFAAFGLLYALTAQRGPAWQDSGIFQWRILEFDLKGWLGLALAHPLLIVLGKLFSLLPIGPLAWRMNLPSALGGAVAVANVALLVRRIAPRPRFAAWIAAGSFGLAHTVWWLATICESQTLFVALFTLQLHVVLSLIRRPGVSLVFLLGVLSGLSLTVHNLALLALPGYGLVVLHLCLRRQMDFRAIFYVMAGWAIGASGFLAMIVMEAGRVGASAAIRSALFGHSWAGAVTNLSLRPIMMGCGYVLFNFPNLVLPLAVVGIVVQRRRLERTLYVLLVYLTCVYYLFAIRYRVADQFMFFLPAYAMTCLWAGAGLAHLCRSGARRRWLSVAAACLLATTPAIYAAAPRIWSVFHLPLPGRKDLADRDPGRYWLQPWKADENSAGIFARRALRNVPPGSVIVADSTSLYPLLWVRRIEKSGEKVRLVAMGDATPESLPRGASNVFVVSGARGYHPRWLTRGKSPPAELVRDVASGLYRVQWRSPFDTAEPVN